MKAVPWPLPALSTRIEPLWASTSCLAIDKPETETGMIARARSIALAEPIEDVRQKFRSDADAVVGHAHLEASALSFAPTR